MHIILDNGHGADDFTNGKYSPILNPNEFDCESSLVYKYRYREGNGNREIVNRLRYYLTTYLTDVKVHIVVPEKNDISLKERVQRINKICDKYGVNNCIMISVHSNATDGESWSNATGLSVHIADNASLRSKDLAKQVYDAGAVIGYAGNRSVPREHYWVNNFYIINHCKCPCILTENLFYTNKSDLKLLMSERGIDDIVKYHAAGIMKYMSQQIERTSLKRSK